METIGLFQLENLVYSRGAFLFLDVGVETYDVPAPVNQYLKYAQKIDPQDIRNYLEKLSADKTRPVLLISQTEQVAVGAARNLEAAGYTNIYVVAGGVLGLLSEL